MKNMPSVVVTAPCCPPIVFIFTVFIKIERILIYQLYVQTKGFFRIFCCLINYLEYWQILLFRDDVSAERDIPRLVVQTLAKRVVPRRVCFQQHALQRYFRYLVLSHLAITYNCTKRNPVAALQSAFQLVVIAGEMVYNNCSLCLL